MSIIGTIWGAITLLLAMICLFPFLGWANWFIILIAAIGAIISAFTKSKNGIWLNVIALFIATFRLIIGGGIL